MNNLLIKNKSGKGHVEAIISFIIFIGFLIFLFTIFNPFRPQSNANLIESTYLAIGEETSVEVNSVSLGLDSVSGTKSCFTPSNFQEVLRDLECNGTKIIVKDQNGNVMDSQLVSSGGIPTNLYVKYSPGNKIYTIYCSEELSPKILTNNDCDTINSDEYSIGIISSKKLWGLSKIATFQTKYNNDYETLRNEIVPQGNDFSFKIWDIDNLQGAPVYQGIRQSGLGTRVDARTLGIDVIDNNATIKKYTINIAVF